VTHTHTHTQYGTIVLRKLATQSKRDGVASAIRTRVDSGVWLRCPLRVAPQCARTWDLCGYSREYARPDSSLQHDACDVSMHGAAMSKDALSPGFPAVAAATAKTKQ
jgi:hypothetical protein